MDSFGEDIRHALIFFEEEVKHSDKERPRATRRVEDFYLVENSLIFGVGFEFSLAVVLLCDVSLEFVLFFELFFVFFEIFPETIADDVVDDIGRRIKYAIFLSLRDLLFFSSVFFSLILNFRTNRFEV